MKRLTIGLMATAIVTLGVFAFSGCEKEKLNPTEQVVNASIGYDGNWKVVTEVHKEGGTPTNLFGTTIGVRYNIVDKQYHFIAVNGLHVEKIIITCSGNGSNRCRVNGHSYSIDPQADDNWTEIDSGIFVNSSEMYDIMDNLIDSVDVQLLQNSNFSGSVSQTALIPLQTGGSIPLTFDLIWENGNSYGDADIEISVYYDSSN